MELTTVLNVIFLFFGPLLVGMSMRFASRKWDRPLLVAVCLVFVVIIMGIVTSVTKTGFLRFLETLKIRVVFYAFLMLGVLIAYLLYRIRRKK